MKFFKRLMEILRWMVKAPTHITNTVPPGTVCNYCGNANGLWNAEGIFCICFKCQKKMADKVLLQDQAAQ